MTPTPVLARCPIVLLWRILAAASLLGLGAGALAVPVLVLPQQSVFASGVTTPAPASVAASVGFSATAPTATAPTAPTAPTVPPERWLPPLGPPLAVSGPYLPPPTPYAAGHRGIDIPGRPGESALAPVAGTVSFVGKVADRQVLSIRVDARTVVSFEPLEQGESGLAEGDSVVRGQIIGETGEGGHCLAECLHLGVRVDDEYVNPLRYFSERPVLLPW
ncbi:hypothetical protein ACI1US_00217 [Leucobacter sp. BZR 635]